MKSYTCLVLLLCIGFGFARYGFGKYGENEEDLTLRELLYKVLNELDSPAKRDGELYNGKRCAGELRCVTAPNGEQYCDCS